jgi:hypothetical protein
MYEYLIWPIDVAESVVALFDMLLIRMLMIKIKSNGPN